MVLYISFGQSHAISALVEFFSAKNSLTITLSNYIQYTRPTQPKMGRPLEQT